MVDFTLTPEDLAGLRRSADPAADRALAVAQHAVAGTDVDEVALNREAVIRLRDVTAVKLDSLDVTDQKQSGRCWMFAALNVFRHRVAKKFNIKDFEFSEAYLQFHDLLGKAEVFLDAYEEARDDPSPEADRRRFGLLADPVSDGGEWNYVVHLVERYGVVPKYAMPETRSSSATRKMCRDVATVLRRGVARGVEKRDILRDVHRILALHLGVPPTSFRWEYRDKDGAYHDDGVLSPREFAALVLPDNLGEYVVLGHDPRHEAARRFAIDGQTDIPGTEPFTWINADIEELKEAAAASLAAGEPVWFACDVNRQFRASVGVWDADLIERDLLYGIDSATTKAEQMRTRESVLTHAMVFTGRTAAEPARWRVENSWGTTSHGSHNEIADKGYGTMSDGWFDDNVFAVVVDPAHLPERLAAARETPVTVLPAWDAMA